MDDLTARVEAIRATRPVACLVTVFEGHVELAAEVCARLAFPGLTPEAAATVRDKTLMHDRLTVTLGPGPTGRYAAVRGVGDALDFARRTGFPVVVKPRRLHSSMHVTPCRDTAELAAAVTRLQAAVPLFAENGGARAGLHVEEYLVGSNHSVDVVSLGDLAWPTPVVDVVTGADLGDDDFHHFARVTPSALPAEEQQAAMDLAVEAARALRIRPGVAHVELIRTAQGPRVVEVAGRPGGNRHRLLHAGRGIDLCRGYVDVLTGRRPRLHPTRDVPVAVATPYPSRAGVLGGFRGLDRVRGLRGVRSVETRAVVGETVGTPRDGAAPPLSVELVASSRGALMDDLAGLAA
ncbi:MAG TPA: ATP-grasp domain-containing protein, partial [Frankiaceae bacterium]|nr:ATP-grasp domain-containing protein [Frankiaceae bacterium]